MERNFDKMHRLLSLTASIFLFILLEVFPNTSFAQGFLYFPHIACNETWQTEICIINTSYELSLSGVLKAYAHSGQEVEIKTINLNPNARRQITIGTEFSNPGNIGYIILECGSNCARGYTKFYTGGKYRVAIPALSQITTGDIYISHIASDADWWTGLSILNTTGESKELTFEFDDGSIKAVPLCAKEHRAFMIKELFDNIPQPNIHSAVIKNGSGVIGLELFGSTEQSGTGYLSGILLTSDTVTNIYYPHVASDSVWWTGLVAYNPFDTRCVLTILPFSENGTPLMPQTETLEAKEKYFGTARKLNFPPGTAWFQISASSPITGFELFGTNNGMQMDGYTGVGINVKNGVFAKVDDMGWTGIAFVNIEDSPAAVSLMAYDDRGTLIGSRNLNLNPHQKIVGLSSNLFYENINAATYIKFASDKDVVGFQLNGSNDGLMLDALQAMSGVGGPPIFTYAVSLNRGDPHPLTAYTSVDDQPTALPARSLSMEGTYNTVTQETTLNGSSSLSIDTTASLYGELGITITEPLKWKGHDLPTEGAFAVLFGTDIIQMRINPDINGKAGVDVMFRDSTVSFTWDDFEDIEANPSTPEYQEIASFGLTIFEYVSERIWYAFQALHSVKKNEPAFEAAGTHNVGLTETCDAFPPQSGSSGTRKYTWIDENLSGDINTGDTFSITYNSSSNGCWYNDPNDNIDTLVKGSLALNNFIKNADGADNFISFGANVFFDGFIERETEDIGGVNVILDDFSLTTNGGFNMFLVLSD
ncbi:MAG: hypothetical protein JXD19_13025 [Deltaproteobacteria bacterium]|nr:hypothetical protein [Deltaproteobacteria bacterium]